MRPETAFDEIQPRLAEGLNRLPGRLDVGVVLLCDHAENTFPEEYGALGLPASELQRHIAYDIGAKGVTERLAASLGAPAVMTRLSRLLIDCNRGEDDPTLIMRFSDGAIIPGNRVLGAEERAKRIERYYRPYHAEIANLIDHMLNKGVIPILLSVHSFTPGWRGVARPWHAAVLWDKDPRLAVPLLQELRKDRALIVGDNEPYSGRLKGDCLWRHGTSRGLAHAIIEIRQDLIVSEEGQAEWAQRLAEALQNILAQAKANADLRRVQHFGSHTD